MPTIQIGIPTAYLSSPIGSLVDERSVHGISSSNSALAANNHNMGSPSLVINRRLGVGPLTVNDAIN